MKILSLSISNIGLIENEIIKLDKPLLLFYGEVQQGKSTILNAFRWVCGGAYPSDIIRTGADEAVIEATFEGGVLRREWYRNKKGDVVDRHVVFVRDGRPVPSPVAEIKKLLNPFLLDQDFLRNMTEGERKKYFTELFATDTKSLDLEIFNIGNEATKLRTKLASYGTIDLTPVESVDAAPLKATLAGIREDYERDQKNREAENAQVRESNKLVDWNAGLVESAVKEIFKLEEQLAAARKSEAAAREFLAANARRDELPRFSPPDTSALEAQIQTAAATNVLAAQYQRNKESAAKRSDEEGTLRGFESRQRAIKEEKIALLAKSCEVLPGLAFDAEGNFSYAGVSAGMLSTSQIMVLSSALSSLYPEGLGIELMDRAESLGKSIFGFVEKAQAKNLTILATIVGEAPAKAPGDIGVFVVEAGKVKPA